MTNLILATDSYKIGHYADYPPDTETIYSYLEARKGAQFPSTVFFGLQYLLKHYLEGPAVNYGDLHEAQKICHAHFGDNTVFSYQNWNHIMEKYDGRLPVRIHAVPEGTVVPVGNVLMTIENTDPECYWLTNALESILMHVWYPTTVATLSYHTKQMIKNFLEVTSDSLDALPFMLHDFGYRGASSHESAGIGGAGHLVNFLGTDTLPAMQLALRYYDADRNSLAYSVRATEHSVMTARGEAGEFEVVEQILDDHPRGILSMVGDSYDIYRFVERIGSTYKDQILARDGVFVTRPDSTTERHKTPESLVVWILNSLDYAFGSTTNKKGYKVLNPKVRVLWGDGIDYAGIEKILSAIMIAGFSAENMVFGMGGGLLQKINRDTMRFATKASAIKRNGVWSDVYKKPLDASKASKRGKLKLIQLEGKNAYTTLRQGEFEDAPDQLQLVFENGKLYNQTNFTEVRNRAA